MPWQMTWKSFSAAKRSLERSIIASDVRFVAAHGLQHQTDLSLIQEAMGDILAAKRVMKDNPEVLAESLIVHYSAAILYEQNKKSKESADVMRIALEDAEVLKRMPDVPIAVQVHGIFLAPSRPRQLSARSATRAAIRAGFCGTMHYHPR